MVVVHLTTLVISVHKQAQFFRCYSRSTPFIMNWIPLTDEAQLDEIVLKSNNKPQVLFKHSTRCSISSMAKSRLERSEAPGEADFYLLDLIANRNISNKIEQNFNVYHESPQVLVIRNGECVYDESHGSIDMEEIKEQVLVSH